MITKEEMLMQLDKDVIYSVNQLKSKFKVHWYKMEKVIGDLVHEGKFEVIKGSGNRDFYKLK
jgi:hypothetical protein